MENVGSSLQILDTPPISPPHQSNPSLLSQHSNNTDVIKVITINPDGNFHLPNEAKVMLPKNNVPDIRLFHHITMVYKLKRSMDCRLLDPISKFRLLILGNKIGASAWSAGCPGRS